MLDVDGDVVWSTEFSIAVNHGRFLVFESDWGDTSVEAIDFHIMEISQATSPKGIEMREGGALVAPCTVHLRRGADTPLGSIAVLEHHEAGESEDVRFDKAILFEAVDGERFAIYAPNSIKGGLELTTSPSIIEGLIRKFPERTRSASSTGERS
jgi:hypothetical protein